MSNARHLDTASLIVIPVARIQRDRRPLRGVSMLRAVGFFLPVIPVWRTLSDRNKRCFALVERPLMGIPAGIIGTAMARAIAAAMLGSATAVPFWRNVGETYCSYQAANLIRNGVNLDECLTNRAKMWLNYWYSVGVYALCTAADKIAHVQDHALAELGYAMIWPLLSQQIATYVVTPLLFHAFPKNDLLRQLRRSGVSTTALRADLARHALQRCAQGPSADDPTGIRLHGELRVMQRWLDYFRAGLVDDAPTPRHRLAAHWLFKTGVSVTLSALMIAIYFLLRFCLVGFGEYVGPLVLFGRTMMQAFGL